MPYRATALLVLLAACSTDPGATYDPDSDTMRGMGDAGPGARADAAAQCAPGLLWCYVAGAQVGSCVRPSVRDNCGRCRNVCTPSRACTASASGFYSCTTP